MCDGATDDIRDHGLQGLLVAVIIGDGQHEAAVGALFVALDVRFLAHHADRFVCGLNLHSLDVTHRHAIDHRSLVLLLFLS